MSTARAGHLTDGAFSLPEALRAGRVDAPHVQRGLAITFRQHIGANDALRTGAYSKTLTFTLSTTTPWQPPPGPRPAA